MRINGLGKNALATQITARLMFTGLRGIGIFPRAAVPNFREHAKLAKKFNKDLIALRANGIKDGLIG